MHQPVDPSSAMLDRYRELLNSIDTRAMMRRVLYRGFDSFEDYFKYGEAFQPIKPREEYTMEQRKYLTPPPDPNK